MTFHKHNFPIQNIAAAPQRVEVVSGWCDETKHFGFHKMYGKSWIATDLMSGTRICKFPTRRECAEWIEANMKAIERRKRAIVYMDMVRNFEKLIEEELQNV